MKNDRYLTRRALLVAAGLGAVTLSRCHHARVNEDAVPPEHVVSMVANVGGIHDQGFCQLSWDGLQRLHDEHNYRVSYIETKQESDYATNLDKVIDYGAEFVWAIGYSMADATYFTARINQDLDIGFGIVDSSTNGLPNLTGVLFAAQEPSFAVGYVAGRTTKTGKVGFVGGMESDNLYAFEYGFLAGVDYAAHELGCSIDVQRQYAGAFNDSAKGKSIAQKMYGAGADVIYQAAGATGIGVIEASKELGHYAIGVDMDQAYLSPGTVITSALKRVDEAIVDLTPRLLSGEIAGGSDVVLHLSDGDYMGIPEEHSLMPEGVYEDTLALMGRISTGEIVVPADKDSYASYRAAL